MWEATDDFSLTTKRIMEVIRKMEECRRVCNLSYDEENYCFRELRRMLTYLGGYDYENANNACKGLTKQIELKNHALKNYKKYIMKDINHKEENNKSIIKAKRVKRTAKSTVNLPTPR